MCGIVAIAGGLDMRDESTMKNMLLLDYPRGEHSTGFAAIRSSNEEAKIAKISSNPIDLFQMQSFKDALHGNSSDVFIGHNRHATRGAISTFNAHPFHCDHIVGVHNGTLTYATVGALESAVGEKFSVDSQLLFKAIAKLGIKETMKLMEEGRDSWSGAWALVWYDQREKTLNVIKNKYRPLWFAFTKDFKRLFIASENETIKAAFILAKNAYELYVNKKGYGYFPYENDMLYKYDVDAFKRGGKIPKPKVTPMKGKEASGTGTASPLWSSEDWDVWNDAMDPEDSTTPGTHISTVGKANSNPKTGCSTSPQKTERTVISLDKPMVKHLIGTPDKPFGGFITPDRWMRFADSHGHVSCCFCWKDIEFDTPGVTVLDTVDKVLCPRCSGHSSLEEQPATRIYVQGSVLDNLS